MKSADRSQSCKNWIRAYLLVEGGYANVDTVRSAAKRLGFNRAEVKAARKETGITTFYRSDWRGKDTGEYYWCLPGKEPEFCD